MSKIVQFIKLDKRALPPTNAYAESAGWDLYVLEDTFIPVGSGVDVRSGLAVALPPGCFARIVGRSSTFRKRGLLVVEGIIDEGFRGELFSYVYNPENAIAREVPGQYGIELKAGESVAQVIVHEALPVQWHWCPSELPPSRRGDQGFGSSGGFLP